METKRIKWSKKQRQEIWQMYMGQVYRGECLCCCSEPITPKNFDIGHIESLKTGGSNEYDNVRPICGHCNNTMGITNMIAFQRLRFPNAKPIKTPVLKIKRNYNNRQIQNNISANDVYVYMPPDNVSKVMENHAAQQQTQTIPSEQQRIQLRNRIMTFIVVVAVIIILITIISSRN